MEGSRESASQSGRRAGKTGFQQASEEQTQGNTPASRFADAQSELNGMKSEARNPRSERSPKPEIRRRSDGLEPFGVRPSDFGFISDFGLRISDFPPLNSQPKTKD